MTIENPFESFELAPSDNSFPMIYTGCTISFRASNAETRLVVLCGAVGRLVRYLPFLTGVVMPSTGKPGAMELHPPTQGKAKSDMVIMQRLPHLRLPVPVNYSSSMNFDYDCNAALTIVPVHIATSATDHPVMLSLLCSSTIWR